MVVTLTFSPNLPFILPVSPQGNSHSTINHPFCLFHSTINEVQSTELQQSRTSFEFYLVAVANWTFYPNSLLLQPFDSTFSVDVSYSGRQNHLVILPVCLLCFFAYSCF